MNSSAATEGFSLSIGEALRLSPPLLRDNGINPVPALVPVLYRAPSRLCERHIGIRTEAHVAALAVELESENPGPRPGQRDPKIEAAAVVQDCRPLRPCHLDRGQLAGVCHPPRLLRYGGKEDALPLSFPH